jgi:hypothetical protein
VSVIVNQKLFAEALGLDDEAFITIRTQAHDFAYDPIARDFDPGNLTFRI